MARNGSGVIEYPTKDGDTVFRIQWRDASGRQIKRTLGRKSEGWTRTLAKAERRKRMGKDADGYVHPEAVRFSEFADRWWEEAQVRTTYAPQTARAYRAELRILKERFGSISLRDLTTVAIDDFTTERLAAGTSPRTVNRTLAILGQILRAAVRLNFIDPVKVPTPTRAKVPKFTPRPPTAEESRFIERELAKSPDPQVRLAFLMVENLALRRSELTGLRWRDLSFEESTVKVVKSKTAKGVRTLFVPAALLAELKAHYERTNYKHPDDFILVHPERGTKWRSDYKDGYDELFQRAVAILGIEGHVRPFHDMRAAWITEAWRAGVSPAIIMTMVGHESFGTTKGYADLAGVTFESEAEKVAARRMGTLRVIEGGGEAGRELPSKEAAN